MGIFDKYKQQSALNRLQEERLYEFVLEEIGNNEAKPGLYAQALVAAEGDEKKAHAAYIKLRVQSLKDEFTIEQLIDEVYRQTQASIKKVAKSKKSKSSEENPGSYESRVNRQEDFTLKPVDTKKGSSFWGNLESDFKKARKEDD